jgi:hypothetical protein
LIFQQTFIAVRTMVRARLTEIGDDLSRSRLVQSVRNLRRGLRHRNAFAVAAAMLDRYPQCYLVNKNFTGFPRIVLAEYRTCQVDDVPLVRVSESDIRDLIEDRRAYMSTFLEHGATLVDGNGETPFATGRDVIRSIVNNGWHILTVDDARHVLDGRGIVNSMRLYLTTADGWLSDVENDADAVGVAESLFPYCEQVIAGRAAIIVMYTPGLPRSLRLWRLSLKGIMPPLPPVG